MENPPPLFKVHHEQDIGGCPYCRGTGIGVETFSTAMHPSRPRGCTPRVHTFRIDKVYCSCPAGVREFQRMMDAYKEATSPKLQV